MRADTTLSLVELRENKPTLQSIVNEISTPNSRSFSTLLQTSEMPTFRELMKAKDELSVNLPKIDDSEKPENIKSFKTDKPKDIKDSKDAKDTKESKDSKDSKDSKESKDSKDAKDAKETKEITKASENVVSPASSGGRKKPLQQQSMNDQFKLRIYLEHKNHTIKIACERKDKVLEVIKKIREWTPDQNEVGEESDFILMHPVNGNKLALHSSLKSQNINNNDLLVCKLIQNPSSATSPSASQLKSKSKPIKKILYRTVRSRDTDTSASFTHSNNTSITNSALFSPKDPPPSFPAFPLASNSISIKSISPDVVRRFIVLLIRSEGFSFLPFFPLPFIHTHLSSFSPSEE